MLLSAASRVAPFVTSTARLWASRAAVLPVASTRFATTTIAAANSSTPRPKREEVRVTFVKADGSRQTAKGLTGQNLLDIVVDNSVDIDGFGACEGTLACSTCHLIFKKEDFDRLPDSASDEELDMLDLAYGLTDTSRLGCQVCMTKDLDGLEIIMPAMAAGGAAGHGPSCFDRVKMGFMMGFCVGMASGALFGGFSALRYGLRGRELVGQVGKVMVQGGGTFGTFMGIGTAIRC